MHKTVNVTCNYSGDARQDAKTKASNRAKEKNRVANKISLLPLLLFHAGLLTAEGAYAQTATDAFNKPQFIIRQASIFNNNQVIITGYTKTCNSPVLINNENIPLARTDYSEYCHFSYQRFGNTLVYHLKTDNNRDGVYESNEIIDFSVRRPVAQVGAFYLPPASLSAASNLLMSEVNGEINSGLAKIWEPLRLEQRQRVNFAGSWADVNATAGISNVNVEGKIAPMVESNDISFSTALALNDASVSSGGGFNGQLRKTVTVPFYETRYHRVCFWRWCRNVPYPYIGFRNETVVIPIGSGLDIGLGFAKGHVATSFALPYYNFREQDQKNKETVDIARVSYLGFESINKPYMYIKSSTPVLRELASAFSFVSQKVTELLNASIMRYATAGLNFLVGRTVALQQGYINLILPNGNLNLGNSSPIDVRVVAPGVLFSVNRVKNPDAYSKFKSVFMPDIKGINDATKFELDFSASGKNGSTAYYNGLVDKSAFGENRSGSVYYADGYLEPEKFSRYFPQSAEGAVISAGTYISLDFVNQVLQTANLKGIFNNSEIGSQGLRINAAKSSLKLEDDKYITLTIHAEAIFESVIETPLLKIPVTANVGLALICRTASFTNINTKPDGSQNLELRFDTNSICKLEVLDLKLAQNLDPIANQIIPGLLRTINGIDVSPFIVAINSQLQGITIEAQPKNICFKSKEIFMPKESALLVTYAADVSNWKPRQAGAGTTNCPLKRLN